MYMHYMFGKGENSIPPQEKGLRYNDSKMRYTNLVKCENLLMVSQMFGAHGSVWYKYFSFLSNFNRDVVY